MYLSKIFLLNSYFSRFHFHYEVEVSLSEGSGVLELSLDSVSVPEKRNVIKYEFSEPGSKIIKDKIPLTGLVEGEFIFALCLFDNSLKRVLAACSYPLELILERDSMMDYLFDYDLVNLSISENKGLICKALVKNLGLESWDENSLPVNVSLNLISNNQINHEIISLNSINLLSGAIDELTFSASDLNLEKGIYSLSIFSNIAGASTTNNSNFETPKIYLSGCKNGDKAKIEIQESKIKLNKYLVFKGKVSNIGETDWYLGPDVKNPFLLGFKLFSLEESGEKYIGEFRSNPENDWLKSGESFEFYLAHELKNPLNNKLRVDIDIVREGSYWLSEFTDSKVEVILEPSTNNDIENICESASILSGLYVQNKSEVKNILVIAPSLPLFDRESGGLRMFEILKQLVGEGKQVTYFYESVGISSDPTLYLNALKELNISATNDIKSVLLSFKSPPDLVILSIWECAERYIKDVRATFPNAFIIADSVDLHWERERRAIEAGLSIQSMTDWKKRKEREKAVYELADIVWLVTDEDKENLILECPATRTMIVSNIHELREVVLNDKSFERPKGLFIGHFRHEPNVSAGLEAIRVIKEYNKSHAEKISLYIVGDNAPEEIRELHDGSEILVMGHVMDVQALERRSAFLLAPLKYGAGIKGKICESISAGLPVITTDIGNEGLQLVHQEEAYIANDFQNSIEGIEYILGDPGRAFSMVSKSRVKLDKYFSRSAVKPILKNLLDFTPITLAIVTYNQRELLESCLTSIFNLTNYPNFKVFVYSNGCTDGTLDLISEYSSGHRGKFSYYRSNENDYFVRPNNKIITSCVPDDVVLLNNDTQIIDPYWLHELNFSAYSAPWVGASGCMVLDANGKISEAGAKMNEDGIGLNLGRGDSSDNPAHNQVKYVDYVSGCCLYMKRSSIDLIGSLDEDFHPMYYEDSAWQFLLKRKGYRTIYTPRTRIIHKEGSSAGTDLNTGMKKFQAINREKFKKKFSSK